MKTHQLTAHRASALFVLISAGGLLSACSNDTSLPEPPATPQVPVVVEPTPEEPPQRLAVAPVPEPCANNSLCNLAVETANQFTDLPDNTCYIEELSFEGQTGASADIVAGDEPHAWVSNSGFVQYLLTTAGGASEAAYQELEHLNIEGFNRPLAFQYHNYFADLIEGTQTSANWMAMDDFSQLQAGDVLTWCVSDWCDDSHSLRGLETGHTAVVIDAFPIELESIKAVTNGIPDDASFYQVAIVDASDQAQGSLFTDELRVDDRRHQSGPLKNESCSGNGGVGSGVILAAQWTENDLPHWSFAWYNEGNHRFHNDDSVGQIQMAFGRIQ